MCEAVLEAVEQRARGRTVSGVRLRVGAQHRVEEAAFRQAFELVADGSLAEGATLDLVVEPAELTCESCGATSPLFDVFSVCPTCGSNAVRVRGGDQLILESVSIRDRGSIRDGGS
jgi:hydrogenase nickel incorporation protein HypA/HybF